MPELIPVLSREQIERQVAAVGRSISADYRDRDVILIGVLKGAFVFMADLVRTLEIPIRIDFLRAASYGDATQTSGTVRLTKPLEIDIRGKDVLLVEDIVDSGLTLDFLLDYLKGFAPASLRVCALIDKCERRQRDVKVDYACHRVEHGFLVGYGLDYQEHYRELPEIFHLQF
jgi:hypoxanthine phosphoribosyltransferase